MQVKIKKLREGATVPTYATPGAAAFDLYANEVALFRSTAIINTGLAFEIPEGHVMLIFSRSGDGFKRDLRLANCVGVIDSDYRGEVMVKLTRDHRPAPRMPGPMIDIKPGQRIAQAIIIPLPRVSFDVVGELSDTERGVGGFGSTGQ